MYDPLRINEALKIQWEQPDAVYLLHRLVERNEVRHAELATLIYEAWGLLTHDSLQVIRRITRKDTREQVQAFLLNHATHTCVCLLTRRLRKIKTLCCTMHHRRQQAHAMLRHLNDEHVDVMYGFFCGTLEGMPHSSMERLIDTTECPMLMFDLMQYMQFIFS